MADFKVTPHSWGKRKGLPWPVCRGCGLVHLRNPLTEWCVRNGCEHEEHPGYRSAVRSLGRAPAEGVTYA